MPDQPAQVPAGVSEALFPEEDAMLGTCQLSMLRQEALLCLLRATWEQAMQGRHGLGRPEA